MRRRRSYCKGTLQVLLALSLPLSQIQYVFTTSDVYDNLRGYTRARRSVWVRCSAPSVCLFVCLSVCPQKRLIPKCSNKIKIKTDICIEPHSKKLTAEALRCGSHSFSHCKHTTPAFTRSLSPKGATAMCCNSSHLIIAYYSFIDPERMKGWVGLRGWPTAEGLPI